MNTLYKDWCFGLGVISGSEEIFCRSGGRYDSYWWCKNSRTIMLRYVFIRLVCCFCHTPFFALIATWGTLARTLVFVLGCGSTTHSGDGATKSEQTTLSKTDTPPLAAIIVPVVCVLVVAIVVGTLVILHRKRRSRNPNYVSDNNSGSSSSSDNRSSGTSNYVNKAFNKDSLSYNQYDSI